jgi:HSP20 family protein
MSLVRWNPARDLSLFPSDMLNMQREINRMFDTMFRGSLGEESPLVPSLWTPAADIAEKDNQYVVKMELPGVTKDDVKIAVQNNVLVIQGEKKQEKMSKGSEYQRVERSYGSFQRTFTLPTTVKTEGIEATFANGILTVTLPKAEEAIPKQIEVKVK